MLAENKKKTSVISMDLNNTEQNLFEEISTLIEQTRRTVFQYASSTTITLFWNIGQRINHEVLRNKRADYGKQIVSQLATQLTTKYGRSFEIRNLRRMMQFSEQFPDFKIVSPLATQLSWSHIIEVLPLKTNQAQLYSHESLPMLSCWQPTFLPENSNSHIKPNPI